MYNNTIKLILRLLKILPKERKKSLYQIIPLAKLGKELRPDYAIIKHCSDNEDGGLGVDYDAYEKLYPLLREAEKYSDETYKCVINCSKIDDR